MYCVLPSSRIVSQFLINFINPKAPIFGYFILLLPPQICIDPCVCVSTMYMYSPFSLLSLFSHTHTYTHARFFSQAAYTTENFIRQTGDARKVAQMQLFAWQAEERGDDVHMQVRVRMRELCGVSLMCILYVCMRVCLYRRLLNGLRILLPLLP